MLGGIDDLKKILLIFLLFHGHYLLVIKYIKSKNLEVFLVFLKLVIQGIEKE